MSLIIATADTEGVQLLADPLCTNGWGSPQSCACKLRVVRPRRASAQVGVNAELAVGVTGNIAVLRQAEQWLARIFAAAPHSESVRSIFEDVAHQLDVGLSHIQEFWQLVVVGRVGCTNPDGSLRKIEFVMVHIQQSAGVVAFHEAPVEGRDHFHANFIVAGAGEDYVRGWLDGNDKVSGMNDPQIGWRYQDHALAAMQQACKVIPALVQSPYIDRVQIDGKTTTAERLPITEGSDV